jgi:ParB family chromosome partitioning protein
MSKLALGRGLDALLKPAPSERGSDGAARLPIDKIKPNRHQPRTTFQLEALQELAESIKAHGLAQPLLVSPSAAPGEYELIAGERRLRAAKMAGLTEVPCVVRPVTERERHELSLIENLQREDLNPVEEAVSIRKLMDESSLTQEDVARTLGKSRPAVANVLRLLDLPGDVLRALEDGSLTEGHARLLLGLSDDAGRSEAARRILAERLTVREVEKLVADWRTVHGEARVKIPRRKNPDVRHVEEDLQRLLGRRVTVDTRGRQKGWVKLEFYSIDDLQRLIQILKTGAAKKDHK